MDFLIQPIDGECCVDPCGRGSPCDPCEGTTTTLAPTTLAPTTLEPTTLAPTTLAPTTSTTIEPTTSSEPTTSTTIDPTTSTTTEPCFYYYTDSVLSDIRSSVEGNFVYIIFETEQCARESSSTFSAFLVTINGMQYWSPIFF